MTIDRLIYSTAGWSWVLKRKSKDEELNMGEPASYLYSHSRTCCLGKLVGIRLNALTSSRPGGEKTMICDLA